MEVETQFTQSLRKRQRDVADDEPDAILRKMARIRQIPRGTDVDHDDDENEDEEGDNVQPLFVNRAAVGWQQRLNAESQLSRRRELLRARSPCCICEAVGLSEDNEHIQTFLTMLLHYDQDNCLRLTDEEICTVIARTFTHGFLPRYGKNDPSIQQLRPWSPANVYRHYMGPQRHDLSNTNRSLARLLRQCEDNLEDLNQHLWMEEVENDDDVDDQARQGAISSRRQVHVHGQRNFQNMIKVTRSLVLDLEKSHRQQRTERDKRQEELRRQGVPQLGYNLTANCVYRGKFRNTLLL